MKIFLNILFFLLISIPIWCQGALSSVFHFDPDTLEYEPAEVNEFASMFIDSSAKMSLDEVQKVQMGPIHNFSKMKRYGFNLRYPVWVKLSIDPDKNIEENSTYLILPNSGYVEVFETNGIQKFRSNGGFDSEKNNTQNEICKKAFPLRILGDQDRDIYIKYEAFDTYLYKRNIDLTSILISSKNEIQLTHFRRYAQRRVELYYYAGMMGIFAFTGIFFLFRYIFYKEAFLLWYGLYLISMGFQSALAQFETIGEFFIFWNIIKDGSYYTVIMNAVTFSFLGLYLKKILEIKRGDKLFGIYSAYMIVLLIAGVILSIMILFKQFTDFIFSHSDMQIFLLPAAVLCFFLGLKIYSYPDKLHKLIGTGMIILTSTMVIFSIIRIIGLTGHFHLIPEMGILTDVIFLTLAIGQKAKDQNQKLIESEKEKYAIQQRLNHELTSLVEEKTKDIISTNKALADQEKLKLEAEFNEKIANAELKALKAQMNPHFIFNCLNAIRNLVQKGKDDLATEYLADFASFIRKVLSYSEVKQITLEEEIGLCELYLKMEQLRFEDGFNYQIVVEPGTATDFIILPPMLLQPLLENAIWHGLLHKTEHRCLTIQISQNENQVICSIDDNGVGRAYSAQMNGSKKRDSVGLKLFIDRLDINNKVLNNNYYYEIIDKYQNEKSVGTKVNLYFEI